MNILALDTSTDYCSVALWRDGVVHERGALAGQSHSEILLDMVDAVLAEGGIRLAVLDGIAYGKGPGSFTGLRIACAVAQGLAYAVGIPLVGIGTLHAMAAACGAPRVICCLDARMQEVYHAAYVRENGGYVELSAPRVCAPAAVPELAGDAWAGCGNGLPSTVMCCVNATALHLRSLMMLCIRMRGIWRSWPCRCWPRGADWLRKRRRRCTFVTR